MLWNFETLRGYTLRATDGEIGLVKDLLFDDETWSVRYLVVDTGKWLLGRKVLIAPSVLRRPEGREKDIPVSLTQEMVRNSPDIDADKPVSRQHETELYGYYGWPPYWGGPGIVAGAMPTGFAGGSPGFATGSRSDVEATERQDPEETADPHLRSAREIRGYGIHAEDGLIGKVRDLVIDDEGWSVRWLVVDTGHWLPGKIVTLAPDWVRRIDWASSEVHVDVTRAQVKDAPAYDSAMAVERGYEDRLYGYYGRMPYW